MESNESWPFTKNCMVRGMPLPEYLDWAAGMGDYPKKLYLLPIQRSFVWKPLQIAQLWDSLLRGMPIGSLMVSKLAKHQKATNVGVNNREKMQEVPAAAIGLLDGQQRTLAMLLGWESELASDHCVWVDLGETGQAGYPVELRITTRTQPFGFQRHLHGKLSRHDRRQARIGYDKHHKEHEELRDFELCEHKNARPWKAGKSASLCFPIKELWTAFRADESQGLAQYVTSRLPSQPAGELRSSESELLHSNLAILHAAFQRLALIEVPLILVPEHISQPPADAVAAQADAPAPLTLLFERIGRNGASLSAEDLLFSMIKQQWPEAHDLVEELHRGKVRYLMSTTDYVMTAYRLAAADAKDNIADTPRPSPNDFHRQLGVLISQKDGEKDVGPLRSYLQEGKLSAAFDFMYDTLKYRGYGDIGLPDLMLPHLSRGLIQVLLRWFMLNQPNEKMLADNRQNIIAFTLFWYLCIWHEDKASKKIFGMINKGAFPAPVLYNALIETSSEEETGLALRMISPERLKTILIDEPSPLLRAGDEMFAKWENIKLQERNLYKRFCWWRKPVLLWLQREYVYNTYQSGRNIGASFAGLTDEDAVPYDYDHLCPQKHWGSDWRNVEENSKKYFREETWEKVYNPFRYGRHDVGNCIGNLHVLDSSLNRCFGDTPLESKLNSGKFTAADSQLYHVLGHDDLWKMTSPDVNSDNERWRWDEARLQAFQEAVQRRTLGLYLQYFEVCANLISGKEGQ